MLDIVPYLQKKKQTEYSKTNTKIPNTSILAGKWAEYIPKGISQGSKTLDTTFEGLREMFEGDSADMCAGKFTLVSMGDPAEVLMCTDLREK